MALAVLATCGALVGAAGCGGDDEQTSSAASTTTAASSPAQVTDKVAIANYKFAPDAITVKAGSEVTWTNSDDTKHTATADDGSFDTGDLATGDSKAVTFDKPGTFTYYCKFHPFMKATVEVQ